MNFNVDPNQVNTGELLDAEGDIRAMNKLMARFVVDASGEPVNMEEAHCQLMALSFSENYQAQDDFLAGLFRANAKRRR